MKKKISLFVAAFLMFATTAFAGVYITTQPQAEVDHYLVTGLGTFVTNPIIAKADGSLEINVTTIPPGTYTASIQACTFWDDCADPGTLNISRKIPNVVTPTIVKK